MAVRLSQRRGDAERASRVHPAFTVVRRTGHLSCLTSLTSTDSKTTQETTK